LPNAAYLPRPIVAGSPTAGDQCAEEGFSVIVKDSKNGWCRATVETIGPLAYLKVISRSGIHRENEEVRMEDSLTLEGAIAVRDALSEWIVAQGREPS
jgi:hypothetical protein